MPKHLNRAVSLFLALSLGFDPAVAQPLPSSQRLTLPQPVQARMQAEALKPSDVCAHSSLLPDQKRIGDLALTERVLPLLSVPAIYPNDALSNMLIEGLQQVSDAWDLKKVDAIPDLIQGFYARVRKEAAQHQWELFEPVLTILREAAARPRTEEEEEDDDSAMMIGLTFTDLGMSAVKLVMKHSIRHRLTPEERKKIESFKKTFLKKHEFILNVRHVQQVLKGKETFNRSQLWIARHAQHGHMDSLELAFENLVEEALSLLSMFGAGLEVASEVTEKIMARWGAMDVDAIVTGGVPPMQPARTARKRRDQEFTDYVAGIRDKGNLPLAIVEARRGLTIHRDSYHLMVLLGTLYIRNDQPELALQTFLQARDINPGSPRLQARIDTARAMIKIKNGDFAGAFQELEAGIKSDPTYERAVQLRVDLVKRLDLTPDPEAWRNNPQEILKRAVEGVNHGAIEEGIQLLREGLIRFPKHMLLSLKLGELLLNSGRYREALEVYETQAEAKIIGARQRSGLHVARGMAALEKGEEVLSVGELLAATIVDPNFMLAQQLNEAAKRWIREKERIARGANNVDVFQRRAEQALILGLREDAAASARSAIDLKSRNPKSHLLLISALHGVGELEDAENAWKLASRYFPNHTELQALGQRLGFSSDRPAANLFPGWKYTVHFESVLTAAVAALVALAGPLSAPSALSPPELLRLLVLGAVAAAFANFLLMPVLHFIFPSRYNRHQVRQLFVPFARYSAALSAGLILGLILGWAVAPAGFMGLAIGGAFGLIGGTTAAFWQHQRDDHEPIRKLVRQMGLRHNEWSPRNWTGGKVDAFAVQKRLKGRPDGKLILVTAISPTASGEGKSTTSAGLTQGLGYIGENVVLTQREESRAPLGGSKGSAKGAGRAGIVTGIEASGDMDAIALAHMSALGAIERELYRTVKVKGEPIQNPLRIKKIVWPGVVDQNLAALRKVTAARDLEVNKTKFPGLEHDIEFVVVPASEVMAILALAENEQDLRKRLDQVVLAYDEDDKPITAKDIGASGYMWQELVKRQALQPNIAQTVEGQPVLVHAGPFGNIAHGCNSVIALRTALKLGDYVVTEAGFGADLGGEKFIDVVSRQTGIRPSAAVMVVTAKAVMEQGELQDAKGNRLRTEEEALERGYANLDKHLENLRQAGLPVVIALNAFDQDKPEHLAHIQTRYRAMGYEVEVSRAVREGGAGAANLAKAVVRASAQGAVPVLNHPYEMTDSIETKIEKLARNIYGADGIELVGTAKADIQRLERLTAEGVLNAKDWPIVMAKTQYSFSHMATMKGAPKGWKLRIGQVRFSAGAGFIIPMAGEISLMPALAISSVAGYEKVRNAGAPPVPEVVSSDPKVRQRARETFENEWLRLDHRHAPHLGELLDNPHSCLWALQFLMSRWTRYEGVLDSYLTEERIRRMLRSDQPDVAQTMFHFLESLWSAAPGPEDRYSDRMGDQRQWVERGILTGLQNPRLESAVLQFYRHRPDAAARAVEQLWSVSPSIDPTVLKARKQMAEFRTPRRIQLAPGDERFQQVLQTALDQSNIQPEPVEADLDLVLNAEGQPRPHYRLDPIGFVDPDDRVINATARLISAASQGRLKADKVAMELELRAQWCGLTLGTLQNYPLPGRSASDLALLAEYAGERFLRTYQASRLYASDRPLMSRMTDSDYKAAEILFGSLPGAHPVRIALMRFSQHGGVGRWDPQTRSGYLEKYSARPEAATVLAQAGLLHQEGPDGITFRVTSRFLEYVEAWKEGGDEVRSFELKEGFGITFKKNAGYWVLETVTCNGRVERFMPNGQFEFARRFPGAEFTPVPVFPAPQFHDVVPLLRPDPRIAPLIAAALTFINGRDGTPRMTQTQTADFFQRAVYRVPGASLDDLPYFEQKLMNEFRRLVRLGSIYQDPSQYSADAAGALRWALTPFEVESERGVASAIPPTNSIVTLIEAKLRAVHQAHADGDPEGIRKAQDEFSEAIQGDVVRFQWTLFQPAFEIMENWVLPALDSTLRRFSAVDRDDAKNYYLKSLNNRLTDKDRDSLNRIEKLFIRVHGQVLDVKYVEKILNGEVKTFDALRLWRPINDDDRMSLQESFYAILDEGALGALAGYRDILGRPGGLTYWLVMSMMRVAAQRHHASIDVQSIPQLATPAIPGPDDFTYYGVPEELVNLAKEAKANRPTDRPEIPTEARTLAALARIKQWAGQGDSTPSFVPRPDQTVLDVIAEQFGVPKGEWSEIDRVMGRLTIKQRLLACRLLDSYVRHHLPEFSMPPVLGQLYRSGMQESFESSVSFSSKKALRRLAYTAELIRLACRSREALYGAPLTFLEPTEWLVRQLGENAVIADLHQWQPPMPNDARSTKGVSIALRKLARFDALLPPAAMTTAHHESDSSWAADLIDRLEARLREGTADIELAGALSIIQEMPPMGSLNHDGTYDVNHNSIEAYGRAILAVNVGDPKQGLNQDLMRQEIREILIADTHVHELSEAILRRTPESGLRKIRRLAAEFGLKDHEAFHLIAQWVDDNGRRHVMNNAFVELKGLRLRQAKALFRALPDYHPLRQAVRWFGGNYVVENGRADQIAYLESVLKTALHRELATGHFPDDMSIEVTKLVADGPKHVMARVVISHGPQIVWQFKVERPLQESAEELKRATLEEFERRGLSIDSLRPYQTVTDFQEAVLAERRGTLDAKARIPFSQVERRLIERTLAQDGEVWVDSSLYAQPFATTVTYTSLYRLWIPRWIYMRRQLLKFLNSEGPAPKWYGGDWLLQVPGYFFSPLSELGTFLTVVPRALADEFERRLYAPRTSTPSQPRSPLAAA